MAEAAKGLDCGMTAVLGLDREKLSACCEQAAETGCVQICTAARSIRPAKALPDRRALHPFRKRFPPKHCARCLKTCDPAAVPYCITHALIEAVKGNVEEGLFFCGENVGRLDRMRTVRELMDELVTEWRQNL